MLFPCLGGNYKSSSARAILPQERPRGCRVLELQAKKQERFVLARQHVIDGLIENVEKALGRKPVKLGKGATETYVYRGDVANRALQMLGSELAMFTERKEIKHAAEFEKYSDAELVQLLIQEAQTLLLSGGGDNGDPGD